MSGTGFVGLGAMGEPMAARLAGTDGLTLYDTRADVTGRVAAATSARAARSVQDLAAMDVVVLMLPDSDAVTSVLIEHGLLASLAPGSTVVDMGSSDPVRTRELAAAAARRGVGLVDAPVSGGVGGARSGRLAVMVGGEPVDVAKVEHIFHQVGSSVVHVGPTGSGHAMKALNNMLGAIGFLAATEVLAVGVQFGLDPRTMVQVLNASTGRNQATECKLEPFVLSRRFDSNFSMRLLVKDLTTAANLPGAGSSPSGIMAVAQAQWSQALTMLGAEADHTEIARYVESATGTKLQ